MPKTSIFAISFSLFGPEMGPKDRPEKNETSLESRSSVGKGRRSKLKVPA